MQFKKSLKKHSFLFLFSLFWKIRKYFEIFHKKIWENVATFKSIRTPTDLMDLV